VPTPLHEAGDLLASLSFISKEDAKRKNVLDDGDAQEYFREMFRLPS
jgi:hypothetical protein